MFDDLLLKICDYMVHSLITDISNDYPISDSEKESLILWYRGLFFGLISAWLHDGMNEDQLPSFRDACLMQHDILEQILKKKFEK